MTENAWLLRENANTNEGNKVTMKIIRMDELEMEVEIIGAETCLLNSLRRILLSEVPTMAFDRIEIINNTSIMNDKELADRLGLIPLTSNHDYLNDRTEDDFNQRKEGEHEPDRKPGIIFDLKVKCNRNPSDPEGTNTIKEVFSSDLQLQPSDDQSRLMSPDKVRPVHGNIFITKLIPGQKLDIKLYAFEGTGRDHAKFCPVAAVFYRPLHIVKLLKRVKGEAALRLKQCLSLGVIDLFVNENSEQEARVVGNSSRLEMDTDNYQRYDDLKDAVEIKTAHDQHYIFSIESVGTSSPNKLFAAALNILSRKCQHFIDQLDNAFSNSSTR